MMGRAGRRRGGGSVREHFDRRKRQERNRYERPSYRNCEGRDQQHQRTQHSAHTLHAEHSSQIASTILRGGRLGSNGGSHRVLPPHPHAHQETAEHHLLPDVHAEDLRGLYKNGRREGRRISGLDVD